TLQTSKSPTVFGEPVFFQAHVTANAPSTLTPAGAVTFVDTTTNTTPGPSPPDSSGRAGLQLSSPAHGPPPTHATYHTHRNYTTNNASVTQVVNPAPTSTAVAPSVNPSVFEQPVTYTATVTANAPSTAVPTGSVVFNVDGTDVATQPLGAAGRAAFTTGLPLGSHTVLARYQSDTPNFDNSTSTPITETVTPAPTTTALSSSANPSPSGLPVTFTAVVGAAPSAAVPTGTVTFRIDGVPAAVVAVDATGKANFTTAALAPGSHSVTATYTPNSANFLASSS